MSARRPAADRLASPPATTTLMTDAELAARLKVPTSWVADKAKAGQIPCTFLGRHRRYTEAHYQQIVAAGERPATSPLAA